MDGDEREPPEATTGPRILRLFIALELNHAMREAIMAAQRALQRRAELPVRWVRAEQAHLTLQFLGNVVATHLPVLARSVAPAVVGHSPLLLRAGEIGAFPSVDAPRVLWLGVRGDEARLVALQRAVTEAVRGVEGVVADRKAFRPHLTLGRVRNGLRDAPGLTPFATALARPVVVGPAGWPVDSVALIRSVLGGGGPRYTVLERFPLAGGATTR